VKLSIKGHMSYLPKEDTCIIHRTKKAKTCALKVTNEKSGNYFLRTIVCIKYENN
jgi:hypothetical protein